MKTHLVSPIVGILLVFAFVAGVFAQPARHLFLDPAFIQDSENATLRVNPPRRREMVIRPDRPWEQLMISLFLTVRDEGDRLRMWYICRDEANRPNVAYAESTDGIHWTKPNLGIVDRDGSTDNNLVGLTSLEGTVFQDPNVPPSERYTYVTHVFNEGMVRFFSPDGLHWQRDKEPLFRLGSDTQNVTFWDDRLGKYVLYLRGWERGPNKDLYRKVIRTEIASLTSPLPIAPSPESLHIWGKDKVPVIGDELPTVFRTDQLDPPNSDVYNISAQPYPLDPRWYLGFPSIFRRDRNRSDGRLEVQFLGSRDGIVWHRYDRKPYAPLGLADSETANMTFMATGMVLRGDEIWQYVAGFRSRHGDVEARRRKTDGFIYRYVQRVDGFVSLDFDTQSGRCITAPVKVDGPRLLLNVDTGALGAVRVGLFDLDGQPLPGFRTEQCDVIRTNATGVEVSWTGRHDLSSLVGQEVRVELSGYRAKIYAFRFEDLADKADSPGYSTSD